MKNIVKVLLTGFVMSVVLSSCDPKTTAQDTKKDGGDTTQVIAPDTTQTVAPDTTVNP
jgi:hypothetical protein